MKKILYIFLTVVLAFACSGCGIIKSLQDDSSNNYLNSKTSTAENSKETSKKDDLVFAKDNIINRFISEYNNNSNYKMSDISKGNIKTKYFANANNCYIEILNANESISECFCVTVNGGKEISDKNNMFEVTTDILKVLLPTVSNSKINEIITELKEREVGLSNHNITENLTIDYCPIVETSYGKSDCHIKLTSYDYK